MRTKLLLASFSATVGISVLAVMPAAQASSTRSSIQGGDIYQVRNVTKGTDFKSTTSADKCDELQYSVRIRNTGSKNSLNNVSIRTAGSSGSSNEHVSKVTVKATNAHADPVSDTTTVKLPESSKITYVPGSTQLLNPSGKVIRTVNGTSRDTGVMIDSVGPVKDQRFVQFKVRVDCTSRPERPAEHQPEQRPAERPVERPAEKEKKVACSELKVVAIDRTRHTVTAVTNTEHTTNNRAYVFTVKNQDGTTVDTKTVTANMGTAQYQFNQFTPGVYTVSAVISTDAGVTDSISCTRQITVEKEEHQPKEQPSAPATPMVPEEPEDTGEPPSTSTPSSTPTTPSSEMKASDENPPAPTTPSSEPESTSTLPATGPVGVAGVFVGVSALSSIVYYVVTRKFSV